MIVRMAMVLGLVVLAAGARAQDRVDQLAGQVSALAARSEDAARGADSRREDAEQAIALRTELIRRGKGDARRGSWMIDQAAALLAMLGEDGADSAVLFDADLYDQRERVVRAVEQARALLDEAKGELASGAAALDGQGDVLGAARLRQVERDVRLAFFEGRVLLLEATLTTGDDRVSRAERAVGVLSGLDLAGAAEAARRTNVGLAQRLAGRPEASASGLEGAMELATSGRAPRAVWCEALIGTSIVEAAQGHVGEGLERLDGALSGEPVVVDGRADPALAVIVLGARARMALDGGMRATAFDAHVKLLKTGLAGVDEEASRSILLASMARAARGEDVSSLAPEVGFARAIELTRSKDGRDEAERLLGAVADRADAGDVGADALWELAVLLLDDGDAGEVRAVGVLTRLAREWPEAPRGAEALEAALAYGRALSEREVAGAAGAYEAALALAAAGGPPIRDRSFWVMEHARRSLREGRLHEALGALSRIGIRDERGDEAAALYGAVARRELDVLWARLRSARASGDSGQVHDIAQELVTLGAEAVVFARDRELPWVGQVRADLADARTELDQPGARVMYQRLLSDGDVVTGGEARLRLGLGRSLLVGGEPARAFAELRRASELLGERVPEDPVERDRFWQCWTLMLELLADANEDGSRSGLILAHIVRLETLDASLGGPAWKARIEDVRSRVRRAG